MLRVWRRAYGSGDAYTFLILLGFVAGDNSTHKGEVLAFNAEKGQHLVFYDDGEDEWVDLSLQHVTWHEHVRGVTVAHGLPAGKALAARLLCHVCPAEIAIRIAVQSLAHVQAVRASSCCSTFPLLTLPYASNGLPMALSLV